MPQRCVAGLAFVALAFALAATSPAATPIPQPEGTQTVALATFGNECWLPHLYPRAEDVKYTFTAVGVGPRVGEGRDIALFHS
jgi:hypothetical protein